MNSTPHTDIRPNHLIYKISPERTWPYLSLMRLDRPIGTWLLLLPGWWSIAAANGPIHLYFLFALGAIIMRGAGCVINDMWDRDFDKAVERTRNRPLASGAISMKQAIVFLGGLLLGGLLILVQLPPIAIGLGALSLVPVVLYPLAKRVTWYPQAVLGLTFNFGALMGWAAVTNSLSLPPLLLYIAGFFWTLGYDTIYAHQDTADDGLIGIKSTARKFGTHSPAYITGFYILTALMIFAAGYFAHLSIPFYIFWGLSALHLVWQIHSWKITDPTDCLKKFRSNRDFGLLVWAGILWGSLP